MDWKEKIRDLKQQFEEFSEAARVPGPQGAAHGPSAASENPSTDRLIAWIRKLKDGFDGQLPMGEESIE